MFSFRLEKDNIEEFVSNLSNISAYTTCPTNNDYDYTSFIPLIIFKQDEELMVYATFRPQNIAMHIREWMKEEIIKKKKTNPFLLKIFEKDCKIKFINHSFMLYLKEKRILCNDTCLTLLKNDKIKKELTKNLHSYTEKMPNIDDENISKTYAL